MEPPRLLETLYEEIHEKNLILILPEIVKLEWERHKESKIINKITKDTQDRIENLKNLCDFLERKEGFPFEGNFDLIDKVIQPVELSNLSELSKKVQTLIEDLKVYAKQITEKAKNNVRLVEEIFNHSNTIVLPPDDDTARFIVQLAMEHKFPFENKKNNFADCLIFYQFINFLKKLRIDKAHFVTANKADFFPNGALHESYDAEIKLTDSYFHTSLSEALNQSLKRELVSLKEMKQITLLAHYEEWEKNKSVCKHCSDYDSPSYIYLNQVIDIIDNRNHPDPDQLSLFDTESQLSFSQDFTACAECFSCGTLHAVCPECGEIWGFCEEEYSQNETQVCRTCETIFIYHPDGANPGQMPTTCIELLDPFNRCEICGNEYDYIEGMGPFCSTCN